MPIDSEMIGGRLFCYREVLYDALQKALTDKAQRIVDRAMEGDLASWVAGLELLATAFVLLENACDEALQGLYELPATSANERACCALRQALDQAKKVYEEE